MQRPEDVDISIKALESILDAKPYDQAALAELFDICVEHKRYKAPVRRFEVLLASNPQVTEVHSVLAFLYEAQGQYKKALPRMAHVIATEPRQEVRFYVRYVHALHRTGAFEKAARAAEHGLSYHPNSQELLESKALSFYVMHRLQDALETYQDMARLHPSSKRGFAMAGIMKMTMTNMREGTESYALHPKIDEAVQYFSSHYPAWSGEKFNGKRLLLYGEQGIGDTIMLAGFLPWLRDQNPQQITLLAAPKLAPLLKRSFPEIEVLSTLYIQKTHSYEGQPFDFHLSMSALLHSVLPQYKPADHPSYLVPDKKRVSQLCSRYARMAKERGKKRCIGISWHTKNEQVGFMRSVPLAQWKSLLSMQSVQWISLQYGDHKEEMEAIRQQYPDALYSDPEIDAWDNVDDLAAQICALDEVITIDNFIVHLAGALRMPTTVLLPRTPDWRWGLTLEKCIWYKNVAMERQRTLLQWQPVMEKVRQKVEKRVK
jgi:ADP-heptose:LPS heptosyltransferase